jgi:predicted nucleotidyltransferase component of viral defense system
LLGLWHSVFVSFWLPIDAAAMQRDRNIKKNVGESVLARLKNLSREKGVNMDALATRYVLERFLYRLSVSPYAQDFCLKGGLLMSAYNDGDLYRPTRDLDLNGFDGTGDIGRIKEIVSEVISAEIPDDDGVRFDIATMQVAKAREGVVPGGKIHLIAHVHTLRQKVEVDVGFGNAVTPGTELREIPTLLPGHVPMPVIHTYPLETVIAEKLHAMAEFKTLNTRHKDYYDIWCLSETHPLDGETLAEAIRKTFEHQRRELTADFDGMSRAFAESGQVSWSIFLKKVGKSEPSSFVTAIERIRELILPAVAAARGDAGPCGDWTPGLGWQQAAAACP